MSDDQYNNSEEEAAEARERINRILRGTGAPAGGEQPPDSGDLLGDSEVLERARERARAGRAGLGAEDFGSQPSAPSRAIGGRAPARGQQAIVLIGGLVLIGVLIVVALVLIAPLLRGGGAINLPFFSTSTPTATATPPPTLTPTATKVAPATLTLPPLTCVLVSTAGGCYDYCQQPANATECQGARQFITAQGANPDVWFQCVAPGPGPNMGEPMECLRQAWRANNP